MLKALIGAGHTRRGKMAGMSGKRASSLMAVGLLLTAGFLLQGCREEEQGRILLFDKGNYIGKKVDGDRLDPAVIEQLNTRAEKQWM